VSEFHFFTEHLSKQLSRPKPLRTENSSLEISIDGKLPPELLLLAEFFI